MAQTVWMAWQFDVPEKGGGVVQAFHRAESVYETARFRLRGLDPAAEYALTNLDTGESQTVAGRELLDKGLGIEISGIWNFNGWVERWGKHRWLPCDPKLRELATTMGQPSEGVMRESLEYPPDGFWWDQQWRITPTFPSGVHFLQPYA